MRLSDDDLARCAGGEPVFLLFDVGSAAVRSPDEAADGRPVGSQDPQSPPDASVSGIRAEEMEWAKHGAVAHAA